MAASQAVEAAAAAAQRSLSDRIRYRLLARVVDKRLAGQVMRVCKALGRATGAAPVQRSTAPPTLRPTGPLYLQRRVDCGAAYATSCTLSPQGGRLMPPILLAPEGARPPLPPLAPHPLHTIHTTPPITHNACTQPARGRATTRSSPNPSSGV